MKRYVPIILAVVVGVVCAFVLFRDVSANSNHDLDGNATAIQIGVFTKEENAKKMCERLGGIVLKDGDIYRVYYSVLTNEQNIKYIANYLKDKGINYYLKRVWLDNNLYSEISKMESLMTGTSENAKLNVNLEVLRLYGGMV